MPLGRKTKDKPQAVRYIRLATWKTEKINLKLSVIWDLPLGRQKKINLKLSVIWDLSLGRKTEINLKLSVIGLAT